MVKMRMLGAGLLLCFFMGALVSCMTDPATVTVPDDVGKQKLFQMAQESIQAGDYGKGEGYLRIAGQRFGDDVAYMAEVEYNLCLIKVRLKDWQPAALALQDYLAKYEAMAGKQIPEQFISLARRLQKDVNAALNKETTGGV